MCRGQSAKLTRTSQLAAAGIGVAASLILMVGLYLSIPKAAPVTAALQSPESISHVDTNQTEDLAPEPESYSEPMPEPEKDTPSDTDMAEPDHTPTEDATLEQVQEPDEVPEAIPVSVAEPDPEPGLEPEPETKSETPSTLEPEPEVSPAPDPEPEPEPEPVLKYQNGTFTGSGEGYYGAVTVSVTISDDVITSISIDSYIDDDDYFADAQNGVISAILSAQSPDVSAVSGATYSSKGIMAAVRDALAKAENG